MDKELSLNKLISKIKKNNLNLNPRFNLNININLNLNHPKENNKKIKKFFILVIGNMIFLTVKANLVYFNKNFG